MIMGVFQWEARNQLLCVRFAVAGIMWCLSAFRVFVLFLLKTVGAGRGIGEEDFTELTKLGIAVDYNYG